MDKEKEREIHKAAITINTDEEASGDRDDAERVPDCPAREPEKQRDNVELFDSDAGAKDHQDGREEASANEENFEDDGELF